MADIRNTGAMNYKQLQDENTNQFFKEALPVENNTVNNLSLRDAWRQIMPRPARMNAEDMANYLNTQDAILKEALRGSDYGESRYDQPLMDIGDLSNLENNRSLNQSGFNQIMSGLGKMAVLGATTFADNFAGTIVGLANIIAEASAGRVNSWGDALNAFVDNPFSNLMQDFNDWAEKAMPNYYTNEEKNSPWYTQFWKANFIGDKFLKNVGFLAGAAGSAFVSGAGWSKALGLGKARDIFRGAAIAAEMPDNITAKTILQAAKSGDMALSSKQISDALLQSAKTLSRKNTAVKLLSGVSGSIGESRIEAITNSRDRYDKLEQAVNMTAQQAVDSIPSQIYAENPSLFEEKDIYDANGNYLGSQPQVKAGCENVVAELYNSKMETLSNEYQKNMEELVKEKIDYSNTSFLLNMLITSVDNIAVFGDAFAGGYTMRRAYKDLVNAIPQEGGKSVIYEANQALARKALAKGLISPVAEGTQEMFQQAVTEGLNRWEGARFNEVSKDDTFYGKGFDEEGLKTQTGWLGTMLSALGDTYSDINQWENFALGFLTGGLPLPSRVKSFDKKTGAEKTKIGVGGELYESIREYKDIKQRAAAAAEKINGAYKALTDVSEDRDRMAFLSDKIRTDKLDRAQDVAVEEGNSFAFKNIEFDKLMSHAVAFAEAGRMDDFLQIVDAYYTVNPEDLDQIKQFGNVKGTKKTIFDGYTDEQLLSYFNKQKEDVKSIAEMFLNTYTNMRTLYGSDIDDKYALELTHRVMSIDNREKRIKDISDKLINYINENVESIAANNSDFAERLAQDDSPLQALQSIKDLAVAFDNDDINELQKLIQQKDISLSKLSAKLEAKAKSKYGLFEKAIEKLRAKESNGTISQEEQEELRALEKKAGKKKRSIRKAVKQLKTIQDALAKSREVDLQQQTLDLAKLLIDRERLLNDFALLSGNKEAFNAGLSSQILKSVLADSNRRLETAYTDFAKNKDISRVSGQRVVVSGANGNIYIGQISPNDMAKIAKQKGNERLEEYAKKLDEYQGYFTSTDEENEEFNRNNNLVVASFASDIEKVLRSAYGKDYGIAVDNFLNSDEAERKYGKDFIEAFEKYRSEISSAQAGTKGRATKKTTSEAPIEESDRLKKLRKHFDNSAALQKMSRQELDKLVEELDIVGEVVTIADGLTDDVDINELSDIPDSAYADYIIQAISDEIEREETNPTKPTAETPKETPKKEQQEETDENEEEDDSPIDEPEEEKPEEDTEEEVNIANRRSKVTPTKRNIRPRISETPSADDMTGEIKVGQPKSSIGNSERQLLPKEAAISKETFAVNRIHAKYQYTELKDPTKRIAIPYNDDVRSVLDFYKVQEFIDSGDLAKLKEKAEKDGHPLRVHFVVLYNQADKGFNSFIAAKKKDQNLPIFMAVEVGKNDAPNGHPMEFYDAVHRKKQMQVIGMVSEPNEKTNPEEYTQYKLLQEEIEKRHDGALAKIGKKTHNMRFNTGIVTNLSWIYSGRVAKAVDDGTGVLNKQPNDQIDVNDLLTTKQQDEPDGHLQISIKTRFKTYDFGNKLDGEEIPLNENRPASGYPGSPISRTATIWIKTKEADGRVYYKGARIKDFNSEYEYDNSPIAKRIKEAIKHIVEAGTDISEIHKGYDELLKYLYLSGKKPIYINTKKGTITVRGSSVQDVPIEYDNDDQLKDIVDAVYNGIKESGTARFSLGLDETLSLKDILDSRIVTTDLGSLHNVNASVLVDKVEVGEGNPGNRQVLAVPSTTIEEWVKTRLIHTGVEGIVDERSYTVPVSLDKGTTNYWKRALDHRWYDRSTNEPVEDDFLSWQLDFYLDMKLNRLEPSKLYFKNEKNKIYIREYNGQEVWLDSTGHILTPEEITDLGNNMVGRKRNNNSTNSSDNNSKKKDSSGTKEDSNEAKETPEETPEESPKENPTEDTPSVIEDEFGKPKNKRKVTPTNTGEMSEAQKEGWNAIVQLKKFFTDAFPGFFGKSFMKTLSKENINREGLESAPELLKGYLEMIDNDDVENLKAQAADIDALLKERNECGGWKLS